MASRRVAPRCGRGFRAGLRTTRRLPRGSGCAVSAPTPQRSWGERGHRAVASVNVAHGNTVTGRSVEAASSGCRAGSIVGPDGTEPPAGPAPSARSATVPACWRKARRVVATSAPRGTATSPRGRVGRPTGFVAAKRRPRSAKLDRVTRHDPANPPLRAVARMDIAQGDPWGSILRARVRSGVRRPRDAGCRRHAGLHTPGALSAKSRPSAKRRAH